MLAPAGSLARGEHGSWSRAALTGDLGSAAALVALAAIFYFAPWGVLYVPTFIGLVGLAWSQLKLALLLPVLFAPAFMLPKHLGHETFSPSEIFILMDAAIAAGWLAHPERHKRLDWDRVWKSPFLVPTAVFLVAATLSTLAAADRHVALRAYREVILEPLVWVALMLALQRSLADWWRALGTLVLTGFATASLALGQFVAHRNLTTVQGSSIGRVKGLYGSPDNLGLLLDRAVPVWLTAFVFLAWGRIRRIALAVGGGVLVLALALTFSRGAWFAVGVAGVAVLAAYKRGRWIIIALAAIAVIAAVAEGPRLVSALRSGHANTAQRRLYLWRSSLKMLRDHPLLGVGPDNFLHYYAPSNDRWSGCAPGLNYMDQHAADEPCLSHPHNLLLDLWLSTGLVGLLTGLWLLAVFWYEGVRGYLQAGGPRRVLLAAAMAAMLASLLHGLVDNSYFLADLSLFFWLLCGAVSFCAYRGPGVEGAP